MAKLSVFNLILIILFTAICGVSLYLKLVPVLNNNFPFTMDQARDMLDIRAIVEGKKPTLIGPTTSINGVFLGPFYYYFNLLPFFVSNGDPAYLTYWNIIWYLIAAICLFVFFFKHDRYFALISACIYLMAPSLFYSSRYFWSANPMPYMTIFYFLSIFNFFKNKTLINAGFIGLISGLSMQVEAAFGVLFLPFFLIFGFFKKTGIKYLGAVSVAFFLTLIPQILFELRHDFIMTKTFLGELSGKSQILGDKLTLDQTFLSHLNSFTQFSTGHFQIPQTLSIAILLIAVIFLSLKLKQNKLYEDVRIVFLSSVFFVLFAFFFYMFYSHPLKGWYLLGLHIPYILITALFLSELIDVKKNLFISLIVLFLGWSFSATYIDQEKFVPQSVSDRSNDKSNLRNELEAVDWVYKKAGGKGFKAYNYIPSVYDYPYQYLYWWQGKKQGYHPETVSYLEGVPEYIQENEKFFTQKKPQEDGNIFLIYEPDKESPDRLAAWLGNFTKFCPNEKITYNWGTTAELRRPCN